MPSVVSAGKWGVIPRQTTLVTTVTTVYVPPVAAAVTLPLQPRYGFTCRDGVLGVRALPPLVPCGAAHRGRYGFQS